MCAICAVEFNIIGSQTISVQLFVSASIEGSDQLPIRQADRVHYFSLLR